MTNHKDKESEEVQEEEMPLASGSGVAASKRKSDNLVDIDSGKLLNLASKRPRVEIDVKTKGAIILWIAETMEGIAILLRAQKLPAPAEVDLNGGSAMFSAFFNEHQIQKQNHRIHTVAQYSSKDFLDSGLQEPAGLFSPPSSRNLSRRKSNQKAKSDRESFHSTLSCILV